LRGQALATVDDDNDNWRYSVHLNKLMWHSLLAATWRALFQSFKNDTEFQTCNKKLDHWELGFAGSGYPMFTSRLGKEARWQCARGTVLHSQALHFISMILHRVKPEKDAAFSTSGIGKQDDLASSQRFLPTCLHNSGHMGLLKSPSAVHGLQHPLKSIRKTKPSSTFS